MNGKPDFSGLWNIPTTRPGNADFPGCAPVSDEFINIAASLKGGLPYQPWAADIVKTRRAENGKDDPTTHCLPGGIAKLHTSALLRKI